MHLPKNWTRICEIIKNKECFYLMVDKGQVALWEYSKCEVVNVKEKRYLQR